MKLNGVLNSEIAKVLADLGHTDKIVIADCGLPIPHHVKKIDLAIKMGTPSFRDILELLLEEMAIEKVTIAQEMQTQNSELYQQIYTSFDQVEETSHENFKELTNQTVAVIRTGEATPFANIILHAGVIF